MNPFELAHSALDIDRYGDVPQKLAVTVIAQHEEIERLKAALRTACGEWRESCDLAGLLDNNWPCAHDYIDELLLFAE